MVGEAVDYSDRAVCIEDDLPQGDVPVRQLRSRARQQAVLAPSALYALQRRCLHCCAAVGDCNGWLLWQAWAAGRLVGCEST